MMIQKKKKRKRNWNNELASDIKNRSLEAGGRSVLFAVVAVVVVVVGEY